MAATAGFADSVAVDSNGTIYYTTTNGGIFRVRDGVSFPVARVATRAVGDSGLLGMALIDDRTAAVHYTDPLIAYDIVSKIDLESGAETEVARFVDDISFPGRSTSAEHHGGNPTIASDGSIFVGIGDFGGGLIASLPEWNGGKVWRIRPDGSVQQFAKGFRNPFDLAWDPLKQRIILSDNGAAVDDEINDVRFGGDYGWPFSAGNQPPLNGSIPPLYVFPRVVAPTGLVALNSANPFMKQGYLLGGFVTKAIYFIPDIDAVPLPDPLPLIQGETSFVIDVTQSRLGEIYFVTGSALYRLVMPLRGDCNGDGKVDAADLSALLLELRDGDPEPATAAQSGAYRSSWGCDADGDGLISSSDMGALARMIGTRPRAARTR